MPLSITTIPQKFQVVFNKGFLSMAEAVTVRLITYNNPRLPKLYPHPG